MGLLDDAIREHLELKRQHGGDPSDIERQEREAFGPAGRRAAPSEGETASAPDSGDAGPALDEELPVEAGGDAAAPPADDAVAGEAPEDTATAGSSSASEPATAEAPAAVPAPALDEPTTVQPPAAADEIPPPLPEEAPRRGRPAGAPGYDEDPWLEVDDEPPPPAEEDVLEETPDFLQETPEHDRLWFEQKPPRDFDWDK